MRGLRLSLKNNSSLTSKGISFLNYLLVDDFDSARFWQRSTNTGTNGTRYSHPSNLGGYTFTATGTCYELGSNGVLYGPFANNVPAITNDGYVARQAFTNLFLNSATGATQSITVAAQAYTLSFFGTGTITLSGTSTAGPLVGTGANNRVSLTFTPTAGSLTLTVSGSCTNVSLVAGSVPGPYIPTTSAAATRDEGLLTHNIYADGSALADRDMLLFVRGTPVEVGASSYQHLVHIDDGTNNNRMAFLLNISSGAVYGVVTAAGVGVVNAIGSAPSAGQELVAVMRRANGRWRAGTYANGNISWIANDIAAAMPSGVKTFRTGSGISRSASFRGTIHDARIIPGDFSRDKDVAAVLDSPNNVPARFTNTSIYSNAETLLLGRDGEPVLGRAA